MKITNTALLQIRRWIEEDPICVRFEQQIKGWTREKRRAMQTFHRAEIALNFAVARKVKPLALLRLSFTERQALVREKFQQHHQAIRKAYLAMRTTVGKLDRKIIPAASKLGRRQGYLREIYRKNYVELAQKEMMRKARAEKTI
jgi:hypothetical protein